MPALYDVAVGLHVATVLAGFTAVAITAGYCVVAARGRTDEPLRRFFAPGPGWAVRLLYPAAALGLVAEGTSRGRVRPELAWVWLAALLWVLAATLVEVRLRPSQRQLAQLASEGTPGPEWKRQARRGAGAALGATGLIVAACLVMTVKPG